MPWAEYWEMLDGRLWWELRKAGVPEKKEYTEKQKRDTRDWMTERARKRGWVRSFSFKD